MQDQTAYWLGRIWRDMIGKGSLSIARVNRVLKNGRSHQACTWLGGVALPKYQYTFILFLRWLTLQNGHKFTLTMLQSHWVDILVTLRSNSVCRCHPTIAWSHWLSLREECPALRQLQTGRRAAAHRPAGGNKDTGQSCYNEENVCMRSMEIYNSILYTA